MRLSAVVASLLVVLAIVTPARVGAGEERGLRIVEFELRGDPVENPEQIRDILNIQLEQPLDRQLLRQGVLTLFGGGEVEYLELTSEEAQGGLRIVANLSLKSKIAAFHVVGVDYLWRKRIEEWFELRAGLPVSASSIEAGANRALLRLRERGWIDATIEPSVDYDRPSNTVDVVADVDLGRQHRLHEIVIHGFEESGSVDTITPDLKHGKTLSRDLLDQVRERTEANLRRQGFWEGVVQRIERQVHDGLVDLNVFVVPGQRYHLEIETRPEAEATIRSAIPDPESVIHPAQTDVLADTIRDNLSLQGYLLAEVNVELEGSRLIVSGDPGTLLDVEDIVFAGRETLSEKTIRRALRVQKGRTNGVLGHSVSAEILKRDQVAIERLYRGRGYRDVEVAAPVIRRSSPTAVTITFDIVEGLQWRVEELRFENFPVGAIAAIENADLPIEEGEAWDPETVDPLRQRLEGILASIGYPHGVVRATTVTPESGRVRLAYRAEPGLFVRFGEIVVSGLKNTKQSVVEEILLRSGLVPGRPHSNEAIIDAQGRLYALGLFRAVEIVPIPGHERRPVRGLVVRLEEGKQRSALFGFGWDTEEAFRLTLGWSHLNVLGGAHAVSVETRASSRHLRFQASIREHSVFGSGIPGYATLYSTSEEFADYSQKRFGSWFEIGDRRRRPVRTWLRLEYQLVEPDAPDEVLSQLEREDQRIRLASAIPVLEWDTRDDPLSPAYGSLASLSLEYAFPLFKAETEFLKLQASFSQYFALPHGRGAFGIRLGVIEALSGNTQEPANLRIPLATRFFAGGRSTHRAFDRDRLGVVGETIDETGKAIGGTALALVNFEYTRPIWGPVSAAVFVDAGNVWAETSNAALGELRWGLGLGLQYETPAGPFRLDYGRKLDREAGESKGELYFSFGVPF